MTDILLSHTEEGGDIIVHDGFIELTDSFETSVYLSLFGGESWFANELIDDPDYKIQSEFEKTLETTTPSSQGILQLEDAAKRDLQWLLKLDIAKSIDVSVSFNRCSMVDLKIEIEQSDADDSKYSINWRLSLNDKTEST